MLEQQFFRTLLMIEVALLGIYGVFTVLGYLLVLISTHFKKQVEDLNDSDAQQDVHNLRDGATAMIDASKTIANISGAIALAVFVGSLGLVGYAIYKRSREL